MDENDIIFEWLKDNYARLPILKFEKSVYEYIIGNMTCFYFDNQRVYKINEFYYRIHETE